MATSFPTLLQESPLHPLFHPQPASVNMRSSFDGCIEPHDVPTVLYWQQNAIANANATSTPNFKPKFDQSAIGPYNSSQSAKVLLRSRWSRERVKVPKVCCSFTLFAYYPSLPGIVLVGLPLSLSLYYRSDYSFLCQASIRRLYQALWTCFIIYWGYVQSFILTFPIDWFVEIACFACSNHEKIVFISFPDLSSQYRRSCGITWPPPRPSVVWCRVR